MAVPLRPRIIPQCSACIRSYTWSIASEPVWSPSNALRQQTRGKKNARPSGTLPVRLLKDLPGFGRRGAVIPVKTGEMRNKWFPRRFADYIPRAELKTLRASNVSIERDYTFAQPVQETGSPANPDGNESNGLFGQPNVEEVKPAGPDRLTPERSLELLDIFIKPVLEFYRQPILEEKEEEVIEPQETNQGRQRTASNAAADLLAARMRPLPKRTSSSGAQAIYGSVSFHDILVHIRAAIALNDESARVLLTENDIRFMDREVQAEGKAKHVGDFTIEIIVKGGEEALKRTVRVKPQEA